MKQNKQRLTDHLQWKTSEAKSKRKCKDRLIHRLLTSGFGCIRVAAKGGAGKAGSDGSTQ